MNKDNDNSTFDFENDPELDANFGEQINQMWREINAEQQGEETKQDDNVTMDIKYQTVDENNHNQMEKIPQMDNSKDEELNRFEEKESISSEVDTSLEKEQLENSIVGNEKVEINQQEELKEEHQQNDSTEAHEDLSEDVEDALVDINQAIGKQICEDMDKQKVEAATEKASHKKKILIGSLSGVFALILIFSFFLFTKPGNNILLKMGLNVGGALWTSMTNEFDKNVERLEDVDHLDEEDLASDSQEIDASMLQWPEHSGVGRREEGVYNILVLGEESIGSGVSRGRTDVIIIATINTIDKKVRLTSILRDTLVQIPGYNDNKINSVYEKGGIDLLYETISNNFNIHLDGSALVNFQNFEKIIDYLGGVEITLTAGEARYLNSTNYISNPAYRNVREGTQTLNGNQALGYCRVRKRATITGNNNDYGRTDRHRIVLNAIFEKYKTKSYADLGTMMFNILPMVTTDIDNKTFQFLLQEFIEMGTLQMEQFRIPADGSFTDQIKVRGMDVLVPDITENIEILHEFIFGSINQGSSNTTNPNVAEDGSVGSIG